MTWADHSKQYNAHTNIYLANLGIPREKLQQEYFVRFCSTSPYASALEQLEVLEKETGVKCWYDAYDCLLQQEILFCIIFHIKVMDNPQGAKLCSQSGLQADKKCQECKVGGNSRYMETNEGYKSIYLVSEKKYKVSRQLNLHHIQPGYTSHRTGDHQRDKAPVQICDYEYGKCGQSRTDCKQGQGHHCATLDCQDHPEEKRFGCDTYHQP